METPINATQEWWVSCPKMTVWVRTENSIVTATSSITRRFVGQHIQTMLRWMRRRFGSAQIVELTGPGDKLLCPDQEKNFSHQP